MYLLFNRFSSPFLSSIFSFLYSQVCISSLMSLDYLYKFRNGFSRDMKLRFTVCNYACCFFRKLVLLLCSSYRTRGSGFLNFTTYFGIWVSRKHMQWYQRKHKNHKSSSNDELDRELVINIRNLLWFICTLSSWLYLDFNNSKRKQPKNI